MDTASLIDLLASGEATSPLAAGLQAFAAGQQRRGEHPSDASPSFWHEMHVEWRRQAGNAHLPLGLRGTLRQFAQRAAARDTRQSNAALPRFPRRLLREATPIRLSDDQRTRARTRLTAAGIDSDAPTAFVEVRNRPDVLLEACDLLRARGLTVVTAGHTLPPSLRPASIVELGTEVEPLVTLALVERARLTICAGWDLQCATTLFGRPSVTLNGTEPFRLYPVKPNGVFLLRTALDTSSGRELPFEERLTESYFRNLRHHAYREHNADDITAAVAEVLDESETATAESAAQAAVRDRLTAAGVRLASSARHVATWGSDEGFLGDGRLARIQAGRVA